MRVALFLMIAAGAGIGLLWPSGESASPPAPDAPAMAAAAVAEAPAEAERSEPKGAAGETVLEREENGHFYANAEVNGQLVRFLIDTGATGVALTVDDARRIGIPFSPGEFDVVGTGASGEVRGKRIRLDRVSVDRKEVEDVDGAVIEGLNVSLLGQSYLSRISSVQMNGDLMVLK